MTGCGVRAIRYALEAGGIHSVIASDANPHAVELAERNVALNRAGHLVKVEQRDANAILSAHGRLKDRFDVVDLDPFGSPAPFFDSASRAAAEGAMLGITATDLAPLCGARPKACYRRYLARPLRTEYCHELAARIVIGSLTSAAAKHEIGLKPLFVLSADHYLRTFVQLDHGASASDRSLGSLGYVRHCEKCLRRTPTRRLEGANLACPSCRENMRVAGPLWLDELFDPEFVSAMRTELHEMLSVDRNRLSRLFQLVSQEMRSPPFYYVLDRFCDRYGFGMPKLRAVVDALRERKFECSLTHFRRNGFRTNAGPEEIKEVLGTLRPETHS